MRVPLIGLGLVMASPAWGTAAPQQPPPVSQSPVNAPGTELPIEQTLLLAPTVTTTCAGQPVQPSYMDDLPVEASRFASGQRSDVVLDFSVAEDGRTHDIRPRSATIGDVVIMAPQSRSEVHQAALAAWRFSGPARRDCQMTVRYTPTRLDQAEQPTLLRYFAVTRTTGPIRDAVAARLAGPEANCGGDRRGNRRPRTVSFPDYHIGQRPPPGGRSWTTVRWNMDADGRAEDVETLGSSGDNAFDAEARRAVSETVAQGGPPLVGCVYNFYRSGPALPAPDVPSSPDDLLQDCPAEIGSRFRVGDAAATYASTFRSRGIEGWALMRFDLATWGQVGNVTVLDAQPASAFGDMGRRAIQSGRAEPGFTAGVRCVLPIRYVMQESIEADAASETDAEQD
jgi:outer membrane biosynthesis protein TonB